MKRNDIYFVISLYLEAFITFFSFNKTELDGSYVIFSNLNKM